MLPEVLLAKSKLQLQDVDGALRILKQCLAMDPPSDVYALALCWLAMSSATNIGASGLFLHVCIFETEVEKQWDRGCRQLGFRAFV